MSEREQRAIAVLESALMQARGVFQEYVRLHRAKNPPDDAKAQRNFNHADDIGNALATARRILKGDLSPQASDASVSGRERIDP